MHRSSELIASLAAALATAQAELTNPEKSLVATIRPQSRGEIERSFLTHPYRAGPLSQSVHNVVFMASFSVQNSLPYGRSGRSPSDAHHLRFAQPPALGRKVSDEFTVPLCRGHHRRFTAAAMKPHGGLRPTLIRELSPARTYLNIAGCHWGGRGLVGIVTSFHGIGFAG